MTVAGPTGRQGGRCVFLFGPSDIETEVTCSWRVTDCVVAVVAVLDLVNRLNGGKKQGENERQLKAFAEHNHTKLLWALLLD